MHPFLHAGLATTCFVIAGCGGGAMPAPTDTIDLGGGLAMTADGAILGAPPLPLPPERMDGAPAQAAPSLQ